MIRQITKISEDNHHKLKKIDGGNMDTKLNTVMDIVDPIMPFIEYSNNLKSVKLSNETLERLDTYRITATESRNNILTRLLIALDEMTNVSEEEEWISFKLTNPYNKKLIIDGQIEYNSKELSYNYRGNVFREKLPPAYIVGGEDLTKELYLWFDNLDWRWIVNKILENIGCEPIVITENDFILEINNP